MSEVEAAPPNIPDQTPPEPVKTSGGINKKLIFGLVAVVVLTAVALTIVLVVPTQRKEANQARQAQNPFEEDAINPFSEEATYQNPFESTESDQEYQNPFEELR